MTTPGFETQPTRAAGPRGRWEAVVSADRATFDAQSPDGTVPFPEGRAPHLVALEADEILIGRSTGTPSVRPGIDLSDTLEDRSVSREHALLVAQTDGSYAIVDLGSSNGTKVNDDPVRADSPTPRRLLNGDRIAVGLWTTIEIRVRDQRGTERIERRSSSAPT